MEEGGSGPICPVCGMPVTVEVEDGVGVASCSNPECVAFFVEGETHSPNEAVGVVKAYNSFVLNCMKDGFVSEKISVERAKTCGMAVAQNQDDKLTKVACPTCGERLGYMLSEEAAYVICDDCAKKEPVFGWRSDSSTFKDALWNVAQLGITVASIVESGWDDMPF